MPGSTHAWLLSMHALQVAPCDVLEEVVKAYHHALGLQPAPGITQPPPEPGAALLTGFQLQFRREGATGPLLIWNSTVDTASLTLAPYGNFTWMRVESYHTEVRVLAVRLLMLLPR
jgi:hypothetical protein